MKLVLLISLLACSTFGQGIAWLATATKPAAASVVVGNSGVGGDSAGCAFDEMQGMIKFTASISGTIDLISFYSASSYAQCDIKWGLYTDAIGSPDALVAGPTEFVDVGTWSAEWHDFTVSFAVASGTTYWLAFIPSNNGSVTQYYSVTGSNTWAKKAFTYGDAWTDPFGAATRNGAVMSCTVRITP